MATRSLCLLLMVWCVAGCRANGLPYQECESDADCNSDTPECRMFQFGDERSWMCTRSCDDWRDCPAVTNINSNCFGVDGDGRLQVESSRRLCIEVCSPPVGNDCSPGAECLETVYDGVQQFVCAQRPEAAATGDGGP